MVAAQSAPPFNLSVFRKMDTVRNLRKLLNELQSNAGPKFAGVGVIVCVEGASLPIVPLRRSNPRFVHDTLQDLAAISNLDSPYHDGFHFLNEELELTRVAQYFSPPIPSGFKLPQHDKFGGRYVAALFGSCLLGVIATGIATKELGVVIFRRGRELPDD